MLMLVLMLVLMSMLFPCMLVPMGMLVDVLMLVFPGFRRNMSVLLLY